MLASEHSSRPGVTHMSEVGEMAQSVKHLLVQHWGERKTDRIAGLLADQTNLMGRLQANERPCPKVQDGW